ncbi:DUF4412 domain-containing protein [Ferruginibacter yonginensis]|uniref:DUF4412 domain-containing protein n=1 Tax=Ferruginibacter yonginensis TaxID=1310416 RepID=A0ABV8QMU8_9BACT
MKILLFSSVLMVSTALYAQPKLVSQATITTSTNVIAPEDEDVSQIQNQGGGGFNFRNFGDGETKSTTYVKNDLVKTVFKSESFRGVVYRDNAKKVTHTVFEIMGNKQGIIASDEDQADMRKRMDSMMKARENADTNATKRVRTVDVSSTITYVDETKKIAGYNCKKALIITDRFISKDTLVVWYTPELKFPNVSSTGGTSGFGNFGNQSANSFDKIDGFVMQYQRNMPRGRVMEVKVTKIDIEKELADKEFELPKDVEFKTMKEMSGGAGGQQFRFGGGRN